MNSLFILLLKINVVLRNNILLGLLYFFRRKILKRNLPKAPCQSLSDPFKVNTQTNILEYFNINRTAKKKLVAYADRFKNGHVLIYGKEIYLSDYRISSIRENLDKNEVFNKDLRFHWEIYRAKYFYNIGLAYFITNDESYTQAIVNYFSEIDEFTPLYNTLVPTNSMEAALKLINISWVHIFFQNSPLYKEFVEEKLSKMIFEHADFIYRNYEITFYGAENNHGLSAAIGLLYSSLMLSDNDYSRRWEKFGHKILNRALKNQFLPGGVNFENSVNYHRFVFELLYFLYAAYYYSNKSLESLNLALPGIYKTTLYFSHCNGFIARMGDSDSGKVFYDLGTIDEFNNIRYIELLGSKNKSSFETLIFYKLPQLNNTIESGNLVDLAGKYYSYRQNDYSILINSNDIGARGKGNHQHNDFLSFELYTKYPFIVDPWNYCYTGSKNGRNEYRSSLKHNCAVIDSREIIEFDPDRMFELLGSINVKTDGYINNDELWTVTLRHDGYKNLSGGGQHSTRKYEFNKSEKQLKIIDFLAGTGYHKLKITLNIPKKYWDVKQNPNDILFYNDSESYKINFVNLNYILKDGEVSDIFLSTMESYQVEFYCEYNNSIQTELIIKPGNLY